MRHRQFTVLLLTTLVVATFSLPAVADPNANAGPNQNVLERSLVQLDGTRSRPDNDDDDDDEGGQLFYLWNQTSGPTVSLNGQGTATPSFTAPEVENNVTLRFTLTVFDGSGESDSDTVNITVRNVDPTGNQPPVPNAGPDQQVRSGTTVTLNGSGSSDPDGEPLIFLWTQVSGPFVLQTNPVSAVTTFVAPPVNGAADIVFRLTVTDIRGATGQDDVTIRVLSADPSNAPPLANAGPDREVEGGSVVLLDGSGSADLAGGLTYQWEQLGGVQVQIQDATQAVARFTAPATDSDVELSFRLTVTGVSGTSTDGVSIKVRRSIERPRASLSALSAFPNPLDPGDGPATFEYDLGADSDIEITITDLFGRLVREIKLSRGSAGTARGRNRTTWDGRNGEGQTVANGGYVFRVSATDADGNTARGSGRLAVVK